MTWHFKSGSSAVAVIAALVSVLSAAPSAEARAGEQCSAQLDRVERALSSGRKIDASQLQALQGCLLTDPAIATALARHSADRDVSTASVEATATVVTSFGNQFHCLAFNSDGTLSTSFPSFTSFFGVYLGDPNTFSIYAWSASIEAPRIGFVVFSGFGVTLGESSIEWSTAVNFTTGTQQSQTLFGSQGC